MDELECKELMRPCKKQLKTLKDDTEHLDRDQKVATLKECLSGIGAHIDHLLETKFKDHPREAREKWYEHLWAFSSFFWPKKVKPEKLRAIFAKLMGHVAKDEGAAKRRPSEERPDDAKKARVSS